MDIDISKHIKKRGVESAHLKFIEDPIKLLTDVLVQYRTNVNDKPSFLDVGGGSGRCAKYATGYDYFITDIIPRPNSPKNIVVSDITACPEIPDNSYDVVYSNNIFEHLTKPWDAGKESVRICKPNGLVICYAPFSWRYHPVPIDAFRFSHTGMQILFTQDKNVKTIFSGYELTQRRKDMKGFWKNGLDKVPVDAMGGFKENWITIYIGQKVDGTIEEELDSDFTVGH